MTSITYKMRKKSNLVPRTYWLSNSLDGAEHNKYIVNMRTCPGYKIVRGNSFQEFFKKVSMA